MKSSDDKVNVDALTKLVNSIASLNAVGNEYLKRFELKVNNNNEYLVEYYEDDKIVLIITSNQMIIQNPDRYVYSKTYLTILIQLMEFISETEMNNMKIN